MRKIVFLSTIAVLLAGAGVVYAKGGFDQFGYNYQAMVFVGPADGIDKVLDGKVWGDSTYANDRLVMKWSKVLMVPLGHRMLGRTTNGMVKSRAEAVKSGTIRLFGSDRN